VNDTEIRVVKITRLVGDRPLKAFVDVQVGNWVIRDWRVIQKPGEPTEVLTPQTSYRDVVGNVRYRSLLSIPAELNQRIRVEILSSDWRKEKDGGQHKLL